MKKGKFIKEIMYLGAAEDRAVSEQNSKMMKKEAKKLFKSYISSAVEKGVLSYLNDIGSQLEESYGDKLVILEGKDFKPFSKAIIKNILNDENKHKSSN